MRTEHFGYFTTIANEGSFSKAARKLYLSEPTLNKNITSFEAELGFKLFVRSKRSLSLTPEGARFLPLAQNIIDTINESISSIRQLSSENDAQLRVNHVAFDSDPIFNSVASHLSKAGLVEEIVIREGDPKKYRERLLERSFETDIEFTIVNDLSKLPSSIEYRVIKDLYENVVIPISHPLAQKKSLTLADLDGKTLVFTSALSNEAHAQLVNDITNNPNYCIGHMFVNSIGSGLKLTEYFNHCMVKTNMYSVPHGYIAIPIEVGFSSSLVALWSKDNTSKALSEFVRALDSRLQKGVVI